MVYSSRYREDIRNAAPVRNAARGTITEQRSGSAGSDPSGECNAIPCSAGQFAIAGRCSPCPGSRCDSARTGTGSAITIATDSEFNGTGTT
jgi:hypothetical protein